MGKIKQNMKGFDHEDGFMEEVFISGTSQLNFLTFFYSSPNLLTNPKYFPHKLMKKLFYDSRANEKLFYLGNFQ